MDFFSKLQFWFHFLSKEAISVPAQFVISLNGFLMPAVPGLYELLYFRCYEWIRAGFDVYAFDGRVLIQHI